VHFFQPGEFLVPFSSLKKEHPLHAHFTFIHFITKQVGRADLLYLEAGSMQVLKL